MIKIIKNNQPISIYKLKKLTKYLSYSGMHQYIDELERKGKNFPKFTFEQCPYCDSLIPKELQRKFIKDSYIVCEKCG